jgi:hypothetical protein
MGDIVNIKNINFNLNIFIKMNNDKEYFDVLSGDDVIKWFDKKNYMKESGTLVNSLPTDTDYTFLKENKDTVRLLVMYASEFKYFINGRALIWKLDDPKDAIFMDKIFFKNRKIENAFDTLAKNNKWYYKYNYNTSFLYDPIKNCLVENLNLKVKLKSNTNINIPKITTFNYYNQSTGELSLNKIKNFQKISFK